MSETRENVGTRSYRHGQLTCEECGDRADLFAAGWRAYRVDDPFRDELPALAFYCPDCATHKLGTT